MKSDENQARMFGRGVCALGALLLLSSCTVYKPLGAGSQVPWTAKAAETGARVVAAPSPAPPKPAPPPAASSTVASAGGIEATDVAPPARKPSSGDVHRVAAGEALLRIARRYGVAMDDLAAANGIAPPYEIRVGQRLRIPDGTETGEPAAVRLAGPPPKRPAPTERYVVQKGDALIRIARRFDVPVASIAHANELEPPYRLRVGQTLTVPRTGTAVADERSDPETVQVADGEPGRLSGKGFLWPVSGKVIAHFGESDRGQRREGIAIAARMGTPVRAAEDGTVVYAGDAIRGYGRMILVRHADGYVSAYAHNSAILVNVGDTVDRGQVIARVGDTGGVSQAQLHFQLRKGRKPIDPETVLVRDPTALASTE